MRKLSVISSISAATTTFMLLAATSSAVRADTAATSIQDLTSLATIATAVTGQPDPVFSKLEQAYQNPLTSDSGWTGYSRQGGRAITLQFPQYVDVTKIQLTLEQNPGKGIYIPNQVDFQAASYGQWYDLGPQLSDITPSQKPTRAQPITTNTFTINSTGFTTNEIRIEFPVSVWAFAHGLHVFGSTTETGTGLNTLGFKMITNTSQNPGTAAASSINTYGIRNMLLVNTGEYGALGTWSSSDFKPMLGYVNNFGYMVAPLFDTMLFLPYNNGDDTKTSWTSYLDDLFSANTQLGALDQAVAATNQTLNRPGYKEKVVLAIPPFPFGTHDFGAINGQEINFGGTAQDPDAIAAREAALTWYVATLLSMWNAAHYQNLQLAGLYWFEESFNPNAHAESSLLNTAEKLAKQNGLPLFWIPFYGATGSNKWSSLGFDAAWLQSNYIEQGANASVSRITNALDEASHNGMGIEVELTGLDPTTGKHYLTFLQTLDANNFGGNNVSHAYYDGSKLLLESEQSTDPNVHNFYDETASFILIGNNG